MGRFLIPLGAKGMKSPPAIHLRPLVCNLHQTNEFFMNIYLWRQVFRIQSLLAHLYFKNVLSYSCLLIQATLYKAITYTSQINTTHHTKKTIMSQTQWHVVHDLNLLGVISGTEGDEENNMPPHSITVSVPQHGKALLTFLPVHVPQYTAVTQWSAYNCTISCCPHIKNICLVPFCTAFLQILVQLLV